MTTKQIHELTQKTAIVDADKFPMQVTSTLAAGYVRADLIKTYIGIGAGGTYTALASAITATDTTLVVDAVPGGIPTQQYWVVVDPYDTGSQCEVREVTARTTTTLTVAALTYNHAVDDPVFLIWEPRIFSSWFYDMGDNSTDNITALGRAMTNALTAGIPVVEVGPGIHLISSVLTVPAGVVLRGSGVRLPTENNGDHGTIIKAKAGYTDTNLVTMGTAGVNAFDCRLENLCLDCAYLASVGVYSEVLNEQSGLINVRVRDAITKGVHLDGSVSQQVRNYILRDLFITFPTTPLGTEVGIHIDGDDKSQRSGIDGLTVSATGGQIADGILLDDYKGGLITRTHFEQCVDGIQMGTSTTKWCRETTVIGCVGNPNVDNLVHITAATANQNNTCIGLNPHNPAGTNCIVNDQTGSTIPGTVGVGIYTDNHLYVEGRGAHQNYDVYFEDDVAASQTAAAMTRADHVGSAPDKNINTIQMPRQGSVTAIWVSLSTARTAGTLTITLYKNGAAQAMTCVIDGSNTTNNRTLAIEGTYNFVAYDLIDLRITTDGSWAPVTADLRAGIEVVT